jgi:MFS family permease
MTRLLRLGFLTAFEATLFGLPLLALTTIVLSWPGLWSAVILGRLADEIGHRLPRSLHRLLLVAAPFVAACWLSWLTFGLDPHHTLAALPPGQPQSGLIYLTVLVAFFLVWRGVRMAEHEHATILTLAGRGLVATIAALVLGPLLRAGAPVANDLLLLYIVVFVGSGLSSLALSYMLEATPDQTHTLNVRWSLLLLLVIGGVLVLGIALAALLSGELAFIGIVTLLQWLLLPFALIGALFVYLFTVIFGSMIRALFAAFGQVLARMNFRPEPPPTPDTTIIDTNPVETVVIIAQQATFVLALIPLVLLVIFLLLWRRRTRRADSDEEHQSLDVGQSLLSDLHDLLGMLRRPFQRRLSGLHAALVALRNADAVTRVRRAYVQALIMLEARGWRRSPDQTPSEWCASMAAVLPEPKPFTDLTVSYERARYRPDGVDETEAEAAEDALQVLRAVLPPTKSRRDVKA